MCTSITKIFRLDAVCAPAWPALLAVAAGVVPASADALGTSSDPNAAGAYSLGVLEDATLGVDPALVLFGVESTRPLGFGIDRDSLIPVGGIGAGSMIATAGSGVLAVRLAPASHGVGEGSIWEFVAGEFADLDGFDGAAQRADEIIGALDAGLLVRGRVPVSRVPVGIARTDDDELLVVPLPTAALAGLVGLAAVGGLHVKRREQRRA